MVPRNPKPIVKIDTNKANLNISIKKIAATSKEIC